MTFKEQLTLKADKLSIKEDIAYIQKRMQEFYYTREYTINLIKSHGHMAIGSANSNSTSLFIPIGIVPTEYQQLFIEVFHDLGFSYEEMILKTSSNKYFDSYSIVLKW